MTYHLHHIVPKHIGGTDDSSNLVRLTVEEHAEAHRLLYEKYGRWQDKCAWLSLSGQIGKDEIRRMKASEANKGPRSGVRLKTTIENAIKATDAWTGKQHTEDSKRRISESNKEYWGNQKERPWQYHSSFKIEGAEYTGLKMIVEKDDVSRQTVYNRCNSDKFPDWEKS